MTTTNNRMQGRDLWLRSTDVTGAVTKTFHRVWDADIFMRSREAEAKQENAKHGSDKASAQRITEEQFRSLGH